MPGTPYADCCGRLHEGAAAATAEELMRSRYSAFVVGDEGYLLRTWHPRTRPESLGLDPRHRWTGLEVLETADGAPGDDTGTVTYRARSRDTAGGRHEMTELAHFARRVGRWVYVDGDVS
ncbi:YchJ family protein [Mobilicoccus pelagius]|uniref:YchJ-like middle NTF2-like domain-containing protein n=1 Tax=Mobilicoccus pelagius NBRC 104925 TaxID=1089455 RepID=H5UMK5_9MICO|nr:YchJ family metal-binding protein [Mobilicoccus pelagius]GAB46963.1 hypothetical protein MOPEL_001_00830 [Mobilicoccus pelagius NBRC 104925]